MKNIRKILLTLLCFIFLFGLTGCVKKKNAKDLLKTVQEREKIIVGVKYDTKPFGFVDKDQNIKGFDVDLSREIAKRVVGDENAVEFQQVTSSNRILSLTSGTVDLVAATMTINPKREQIIDFSRPYYIAGQAIMVSKKSSIKSLKDLSGKCVIVVLGSTSEINIRQLVPDVKILGFRTYTDAFSALKSGRGDALTTDDAIIYGFLSEDSSFKMLKDRLTREPYGIGFKKGVDTQLFQDAVNFALEQIMQDGTLKRIQRKWMVDFLKEGK
ncbi:MAG: transporter substrate-binding domain-containing protein [bacterium]